MDAPPGIGIDNPLDALLGYQLRRASAAMLADLTRSLADLELRPAEASVVLLIAANPAITASEVGRVLGIQRANMVPLIAVLTARGIVDRASADGRSHALRLTPAGTALTVEVRSRIDAHEARFTAQLSPTTVTALLGALRQLRHHNRRAT